MAKRKITCDGSSCIKSPKPPRAQEHQLSEISEYIVAQISKRWRSQVIKGMNQTTVSKFEDAQVGNYAAIYLKLARRTAKKLIQRFDDKKIEAEIRKILSRKVQQGIHQKKNACLIAIAVTAQCSMPQGMCKTCLGF